MFVLLIFSCSSVLADEWIVSPSLDDTNCTNCHEFSYYLEDPSLYFSSDTILIFLEGVHYLNEPVTISGVSNLTLQGEGELQDGSHWTVRESTVKINCLHSVAGLFFVNWTDITINSITFENCGAQITGDATLVSDIKIHYSSPLYSWEFGIGLVAYHSLLFLNGSNLTLEEVTVQNGIGFGLTIVNSYDISIVGSYFYGKNLSCYYRFQAGGNIRIVHIPVPSLSHCPYVRTNSSVLAITNTSVSFGCNRYFYFDDASEELPDNIQFKLRLGGGIGLVPADYSCNSFRYELEDVSLLYNIARAGANLGMIVLPVPIKMIRVRSAYGTAQYDGAGFLFVPFVSLDSTSELTITNSTSSHNRSPNGGGAGLYVEIYRKSSWDQVNIHSSTFSCNYGIYGTAVYVDRKNVIDPNNLRVSMINVTVDNTIGRLRPDNFRVVTDAAVSLINIDCVISGLVIANSSMIRGLALVSSRVFVQGVNEIHNNTALSSSGGGVQMDPHSYFIFQPPASLSFSSNHADLYGGGIYILPRINNTLRPPCFFQIDSPLPSPNVRLYADSNTANITGRFIGGGELLFCFFVTDFFYSFCNNSTTPTCSYDIMQRFINASDSDMNNYFISSVAVSISFCTDDENINNTRDIVVPATPGRGFDIKLVALSETDGISLGSIIGKIYNGPALLYVEPNFRPDFTRDLELGCSEMEFVVYPSNLSELYSIFLFSSYRVSYFFTSYLPLNISVVFEECPPLFELVHIEGQSGPMSCKCNSYLSEAEANVTCNINSSTITSSPQQLWIGYNEDEDCTLTGQCPFGYCTNGEVTFTINETDAQCAHNRSGILCGGCAEGFSIKLGSNECGQCSDSYISLLLVFVVAGIALVVFLIILNLTVTVGTINGLIFYANIMKILEPRLFQTDPVPVLSQFISWINLDFGINVCFYDGMTPIDKIWWQFAFPIYIWTIIVVLILVVRFMTNHRVFEPVTKHFAHLKLINIFATLLLLSYTKLFQTFVTVFNYTNIKCNGVGEDRWLYDGNLEYAKGHHLILLLFSVGFFCVFVVPYTLFLLALPLIERAVSHLLERCQCFGRIWLKLKPLTDAYASPFKDKCRFWVGFLIVVRLVIIGAYTAETDDLYASQIVFTIILFTLMFSMSIEGPYTNWYLNMLEQWFLVILLGIVGYSKHPYIGSYIFSSLTLATFVLIVIWHSYGRLVGDFEFHPQKIYKTLLSKRMKRTSNAFSVAESAIEEMEEKPHHTEYTQVSSSTVSTGNESNAVAVGVARLKFTPRNAGYRDSALDLAPPDDIN